MKDQKRQRTQNRLKIVDVLRKLRIGQSLAQPRLVKIHFQGRMIANRQTNLARGVLPRSRRNQRNDRIRGHTEQVHILGSLRLGSLGRVMARAVSPEISAFYESVHRQAGDITPTMREEMKGTKLTKDDFLIK